MLSIRNFAPFLDGLAQKLREMTGDNPPSDCHPIHSEFRTKADLGAARQHCGAGQHAFEATADDRPAWRQSGTFTALEGRLIAQNIDSRSIMVDGVPLAGFFRWHSDGKATLVQGSDASDDPVASDGEPAPKQEEMANGGPEPANREGHRHGPVAADTWGIPQGLLSGGQIGQWVRWIDVPSLTRETSRQIGMALHQYFDGGNAGLRLWHELCMQSKDYDEAAVEQQYREFGSRDQERTTIRMLHDLAVSGLIKSLNAQIGWREDSTHSAIYQLVGRQIISVTLSKLMDEYGNRPFPRVIKGVVKSENPILIWRNHPDRRDVRGIVAVNSPDVFIELEGRGCFLNIFRGLAEPGKAGKCERFKRFLFEVICGERKDVHEWVWKWMAWIVQNPTVAPQSAIMLNGRQGTGKNLFYSYLAKAIGEHLCYLTQTPEDLFAKHNPLFQGRRLCCADEAYFESDPRHRNEMKTKITGGDMTINPKGVSQYVAPSYAAWVLLSNSQKSPENTADARRITYITPSDKYIPMRDKAKSEAYYAPIFAELDGAGPASLLRELLDSDIGSFKPYPKFSTPEGVIAAKHGDLGDSEWFRDFIETGEFPIFVSRRSDGFHMVHRTDAKDCAITFQRSRGKRANDQAAGVLFQKLGFVRGGKSHKFWILPRLVDVRRAWINMITATPEFLEHPNWQDDEWEFKQLGNCIGAGD